MKKAIAIVAFIGIAFLSASAMAQEPVGPRNMTVLNMPDDGFNVTHFGRDLQPGWLVLLKKRVRRGHAVHTLLRDIFQHDDVEEDRCELPPRYRRGRRIAVVSENHQLVILNTGRTRPIRNRMRYRVAAADSTLLIHQP